MSERRVKSKWAPPAGQVATVVLVHGAIVRGWEMAPLGRFLRRLGYRVRQFRYRSMTRGLDDNAARLKQFIAESEGDIVHVVGHSMGGVLSGRFSSATRIRVRGGWWRLARRCWIAGWGGGSRG